MVTGVVPFRAVSLPELIGQMLQARPAPPSGLPDTASAAIMKAIESAPASRFASADAFARALA